MKYRELVSALRDSGLQAGDIVHVQSDLRLIGPVDCEVAQEPILQFYLAAFQEVLGPAGTLTVGTSFEDYARFGTPFVRETSPSRQGAFSEYIRTRPRAIRSMHPIVSVTGLGAQAPAICGGPHYDGFGYASAWARLHRANAKIMALGLGVENEGGTTIVHYLEHVYGVPYQYTKVYRTPVYSGGAVVEGVFTLSVRYLDFDILNDSLRLKQHLVAVKRAVSVPVGTGAIFCTDCASVVEEGAECLNRDRYFLLARPPAFRAGEIPADGMTGPMRIVYNRVPA
jgi:aminoglycoside 3-N-acetyltransferase